MTTTDRLFRRVLMALGVASIKTTDDSGSVQYAQVQLSPREIRDRTPVLYGYGFTSRPKAGSDAAVVFVGGDRSNGVVIATGDQRFRLKNLAEGEVALYTDEGDKLVFQRGNLIEIDCKTKVRISCPLVELTGDLQVDGHIIAGHGSGDQVNLRTHTHGQPPDGHGDGEAETHPPTAGT